jgi:hypothetical protein
LPAGLPGERDFVVRAVQASGLHHAAGELGTQHLSPVEAGVPEDEADRDERTGGRASEAGAPDDANCGTQRSREVGNDERRVEVAEALRLGAAQGGAATSLPLRVAQELARRAAVEVTGGERPVEHADQTGVGETQSEVPVCMVERRKVRRIEPDPDAVDPPYRYVPGPELVEHPVLAGLDPIAMPFVRAGVDLRSDICGTGVAVQVHRHVSDHDQAVVPGVVAGVTSSEAGTREHIVVEEEDNLRRGGGDASVKGGVMLGLADLQHSQAPMARAEPAEHAHRLRVRRHDYQLGRCRVGEHGIDERR